MINDDAVDDDDIERILMSMHVSGGTAETTGVESLQPYPSEMIHTANITEGTRKL